VRRAGHFLPDADYTGCGGALTAAAAPGAFNEDTDRSRRNAVKPTRSPLAAGLAAALLALSTAGAHAQRPDLYVDRAPPPPRHERVPAPRAGYQWSPGYWQWQSNRHVWHAGSWVRERPGQRYANPSWTQRDGRWQFKRGGWDRGDVDHDGVPNALDPDQTPIQK